jgi:hypothetical protein
VRVFRVAGRGAAEAKGGPGEAARWCAGDVFFGGFIVGGVVCRAGVGEGVVAAGRVVFAAAGRV